MERTKLIWCGETELPAGWALRPHSHDFFHLAYVRKGHLVFRADGLDYPLSEGSLILLPPGVVHAVPEDAHNLCIQNEVMFSLSDPALQSLLDTKKVLVLHGASHLENLFSYIFMHYNPADLLCAACADSFLCAILFSLLTGSDNTEFVFSGYVDVRQYSPLVQSILCHIEKSVHEKYDLSSLALSLGRNKNYLCTAFRRETGITISAYINYYRIRKILVILQYNGYNKEVPIYDLADKYGYANASYFNRVFKKHTGMTPTEFIDALFAETGSAEPSAFQKYYNEYLDLKRHPLKESLEYMQGLKAAAHNS